MNRAWNIVSVLHIAAINSVSTRVRRNEGAIKIYSRDKKKLLNQNFGWQLLQALKPGRIVQE
ncbi:hypothetical protein BH11BAC6_BH11BAC6_09200 [soil metagenome]